MALFRAVGRASNGIGSVVREMALKMKISVSAQGAASVKCAGCKMFYSTTSAPDNICNSSDPGSFGIPREQVRLVKELGKHFSRTREARRRKSDREDNSDNQIWNRYAESLNQRVYKVSVPMEEDEDANSVFKDVMEIADCASGFIRPSECNRCNFYAMLDEQQVKS